MRIATYNVEWFDALFDDTGRLISDDSWSGRHDVTRAAQTEALGIVFTALDADAIVVVEGPDTQRQRDGVRALEHFAQVFDLRARKGVLGFANQTQQEILLLHDPDVLTVAHDPRSSDAAPRFDETLSIDLDIDAQKDRVRFSKPPLELQVTASSGFAFRMIGAHLKSKAPIGATTRDQVMRISIANRRKQLAQAIWLRRRIVEHLSEGTPLLLLGDLNDGPGLDEYEALFGRSSVEIVRGEADEAGLLHDPHAAQALQRRLAAQPTTARFFQREQGRYLEALLDYIFVSPDLRARARDWRIWHPFDDPACWRVPELRDALLAASDHFPVSVELDV